MYPDSQWPEYSLSLRTSLVTVVTGHIWFQHTEEGSRVEMHKFTLACMLQCSFLYCKKQRHDGEYAGCLKAVEAASIIALWLAVISVCGQRGDALSVLTDRP